MKRSAGETTARNRLEKARIARLATIDASGRPTVVPVCFAYDGQAIYTAIDLKPKRVAPGRLARVRHILGNPEVALVVDRYLEDWTRLWYVLVRGTAVLLQDADGKERTRALNLLKQKYQQYRKGFLSDDALIIRISPRHIKTWGSLE